MIRTGVYLHSAITGKVSLLGQVDIWNDATGTGTRGNYRFCVRGKRKVLAEGEIKDFPRKSRSALELLRRCLEAAQVR